jgi:benzoylformate decarboxylase
VNVGAVLMRILEQSGVRYLFGNPGTTELPFLDALPDSTLQYVVGLQEATAVSAADGYGQASGTLGVANVHVAPGVANALSALHNAARAKSPLLLTAGQQDSRFLMHEPILSGDLVQLTEQFTKWSYEVRHAGEAPDALRRAVTLATAPPTGPVFLSLPMELMTVAVEDGGAAPTRVVTSKPDGSGVERAAEWLASARAPVIVAGDGVARARAADELARLAELIGARVHGEPIYRRQSFPGGHGLWGGGLYPAPAAVRKALGDADAVLIAGATVFTWFLHTPGEPFLRGVPVIQLDDDAREIGRSYQVTLGLAGDCRAGLVALHDAVTRRMTGDARASARERGARLMQARAAQVARTRAAAEAESDREPISVAYLMATLATLLPDDAVIVDESASSLGHVLRLLPFRQPDSFFGSKTGTLGWAMGAAIGVRLAMPHRKVVAVIGDGSVMYSPQALWTAARHRLPITYVVPNNASYAILKAGMLGLGLPSAKRGVYPGMDIADPEIDYPGLARALGVRAERVEKPRDLRDVLTACLAHDGPSVVDVAVDRDFKALG